VQPFNSRDRPDDVRFTQTASRVIGRRITYEELTGKVCLKGAMG
jgi:hypothetical protein